MSSNQDNNPGAGAWVPAEQLAQANRKIEVMCRALEMAGRFIGNQTRTTRGDQVYRKIHTALNHPKDTA